MGLAGLRVEIQPRVQRVRTGSGAVSGDDPAHSIRLLKTHYSYDDSFLFFATLLLFLIFRPRCRRAPRRQTGEERARIYEG